MRRCTVDLMGMVTLDVSIYASLQPMDSENQRTLEAMVTT